MSARWFFTAACFLIYAVGAAFWLVLPLFVHPQLPHQLTEWSILLGCGCGLVATHYFLKLLSED